MEERMWTTDGRRWGKRKVGVKERGGEARTGIAWRFKIRKEWREACVDSLDRKPQLHTHTQLLEIYPLTLNGSRQRSCAAPRPLTRCGTVCYFLFCFSISDSDNTIVFSGFARHCGRLILALVETIEYCWREGGGGRGTERAFLSLSPSPLCVKENEP